jgi:predicted transcriptional regulator
MVLQKGFFMKKIKVKEVANMIGCSNETMLKYVKMFYPHKVSRGRATILTIAEIRIIIYKMKQARKNHISRNWSYERIDNIFYQDDLEYLIAQMENDLRAA